MTKMATISPNRNPNEITPMEISNPPLEKHSNWLELPRDVTLTILMKLGQLEILESVQFVCKLWYHVCKDPSMWRTIQFKLIDELELANKYEKMMFTAVDRSSGDLIDLDIEGFGSDDLCSYIASRSSQLKRLRLAICHNISAMALIDALKKLSSLEELELTLCSFQAEKPIPIINACPSLTAFKYNQQGSRNPTLACDEEALAITGSMPELKHLQLIGNNLTNDGLTAILDGCPYLQSLDLRACLHLDLVGDLEKRLSEQIKDFRHPYDSIDDYNYLTTDYDSDFGDIYDYEYEYDDMDFVSDEDEYEFSDENEEPDDYFV